MHGRLYRQGIALIPFSPAEIEWLSRAQHRIKQATKSKETAKGLMADLLPDQVELMARWVGYLAKGGKQAEEAIRAAGTARKNRKREKDRQRQERKRGTAD